MRNYLDSTNLPGNSVLGIDNANSGIELVPDFRFHHLGAATDQLIIAPRRSGSGGQWIRIPYSEVDSDRNQSKTRFHFETTAWTLDLGETTIDLNNRIGGIIDGTSLTASDDYQIWAFFDTSASNNLIFRGIAMTERARVTGASTTVNGALNSLATFSVTTNHGNRFVAGSRVKIRNGTTSGSSWNEGTVNSVGTSTIQVQLDADLALATNNNTTLASLTGLEIFQLDKFEPRGVSATPGLIYPDYAFTYIGSVHTSSTSQVRYFRYRGDDYLFPAVYTPLQRTGITASENFQPGLGNWIPRDSQDFFGSVSVLTTMIGAPGIGRVFEAIDSAGAIEMEQQLRAVAPSNGEAVHSYGKAKIRSRDCSCFVGYIETGNLTVTYRFKIHKYTERNW